ncbi:N-acetyltransferase [Clostridium zeae]|uniref:N-acetyltransferase n=1 Tax=Clostridium zeae TaxID=2759022 RepID=A0ABQ1EBW5_9CLOT|nr:GNAT family N-acetyltransferase [Clostridium zeae]GFZ32229.1 N-acetyltransferase [Clostridium zeae]
MIRNAILSDLEQIVYIVEGSKLDMHSYGNFQWDEDYPRKEDFINDIKEETLFVYDMDGIIAGLICINKEEPEEYKDVNWSTERDALTIHRLAVNNSFKGKGVGVKLINYVDDICAENDINYIRTDTNSLNKKAQGLLTKCGYGFKGKINLLGHEGIFYCYDKVL